MPSSSHSSDNNVAAYNFCPNFKFLFGKKNNLKSVELKMPEVLAQFQDKEYS
jgi:hypothetical protein